MSDWRNDKKWTDALLPSVKRILGEYLISAGDWTQDAKEATDLIVLEAQPLRVACRIRQHHYIEPYGEEFTIRAGRPSGALTELAKIMSGWGTHMFYGFASTDATEIDKWVLFKLHDFRLSLWRNQALLKPSYRQENRDGSSWFYSWNINLFPPDMIVARSELVETCEPF